jgi:asparagine synthase (glutamine-hydrolysing)
MAHRGPDGAGQSLFDTADGRFEIGLGHRRLSIIDIGGGQQPMSSGDGRFTYNYLELREELVALGHRLRTSSDTEVLIEAYRAWGLDAISRFRGMFAFALWDTQNQRLVLARDAFGKKPLSSSGPAWGVFVRLRDRGEARAAPTSQ